MAATAAGRLFSLELLVDWVRLETGLSPCAASPAVAFRLLDFPPLLVFPPAAPGPEPQRGAISFGRGKACLLRLHPAALRRPRLRAALLQLPAGPTSAPRLVGACDVLLVPSLGQRGVFALRGPEAERVGELALFYRLTELGRFPPGVPQLRGLLSPACIMGSEALEVSEPRTKETSKPCTKDTSARCLQCVSNARLLEASEPCAKDTNSWSAGDSDASAVQKSWEEAVLHSKASSGDMASAPCSPAPSGRTVSSVSQEVTELDFETNTFCPPPLYYTHLTQEKTPSARVEITIEPQRNEPEDLDDIFPETKLVSPPLKPAKHTRSAVQESPPVLPNLPQTQGPGEANEAPSPSQIEQSPVNAIRQLPLLNALLIELSLLCNQPMASPTQVHPHLAWLYRGEHKGPDPSTKSTSPSESKSNKLSVRENEKLVNPQSKKNPKGHPKISGSPPPKVTKGRLLYGLTNTLRLRLQQTNPNMLVVHEKREQYRRSQIQAVGPKLRIPSWKGKVSSLAAESQMSPQLPADTPTDSNGKLPSLAVQNQLLPQLPGDESLDSNGSFVEGSDTSMQISAGFDESSTTKEVKQSHAMKQEMVDQSENRTVVTALRAPVSPAGSVTTERSQSNSFGGNWKKKVPSPGLSLQEPTVDKTVNEGKDSRQVKAISAADTSENRPTSRKSSCESISELLYLDGFTSPCYSEDFCTTENNSRSLPAPDSSTGAEHVQKGSRASKSSEARLSTRKNSSEASSVLTPPFSAGSPVCSHKRSRVLKIRDSLEEAASLSTSDFSSQWTNEKENQADPGSSKVTRKGRDSSTKLKVRAGHKSSEKSQSPRTSQVSSYEPSNLSELELKAIDDSDSADFQEEEDGLGSLRISRQCKDICELVINKLPGYTV
ncbi:microtubule-associated protein 10 [Mus caroli]|uniref:Microtubule-associated protein 10 n=1 Tax=Mus caroli TaxID=10089 RepID=A0A6P5Q1S9_MUSCR|nr:microtubule-associated protein 10 [Mus caroli]